MKEHAVSDDRDTAGAAGGADNTAALTQPQRPTGKRSRQRAGATALADVDDLETTGLELGAADDGDSKKAKKAGTTRNPFLFVWNYLGQVVAELRKVIWPNRKQMVSYTTVVLLFLIFMVTLIGLVDLGLAKLVLLVFGQQS
ncbi:preprotein translocase subunit SecE [Mycolicibacterium sp.]|uniref:preprotein translocase subunit SecE n=1 Tax=Mycolicibacterium sp. TaxID=2320850 RepID=UPI0037C66C85